MTSIKDIFEPKNFAANTFACGTWRGNGVVTFAGKTVCFQNDTLRKPMMVSEAVRCPQLASEILRQPTVIDEAITSC